LILENIDRRIASRQAGSNGWVHIDQSANRGSACFEPSQRISRKALRKNSRGTLKEASARRQIAQ
jgi:hypothetical protein